MKKYSDALLVLLGLLASVSLQAQMPHDQLYMSKGSTCVALMAGQSTWRQYWEGSLQRDNLNIGTHTTQQIALMAAYGLSDRLNAIVQLPYVSTHTSAGNLMGQAGLQDLSGWLKYRFHDKNGLSLHGVVGGSVPVTNYVAEFLPMSIGLQSRTASLRGITTYTHRSGLFLSGHGTYSHRSNITVDRDGYQTFGRVVNSNEVSVPNAIDASLRAGIFKTTWQAEGYLEYFACTNGDNIRRNDMPFPTNNMRATSVGMYGKYQPNRWGINLRVSRVLAGQNVGTSTQVMLGILFQFHTQKGQKPHCVSPSCTKAPETIQLTPHLPGL
jgi:hypothetical protein